MDDLLIAPYERLASSRAEMARAEGISERTLRRRLARERELAGRDGLDGIPWVEITAGPQAGHHYRLGADELSNLPPGLFLINNHNGRPKLARSSDGQHVKEQQASKHKFKPKVRRKKCAG